MSDNEQICTSFELKQFAYEDNPTAFYFARFIESKSNRKYTVIEREFIIEALDIFNQQASFNNEFRKKWYDIIRML